MRNSAISFTLALLGSSQFASAWSSNQSHAETFEPLVLQSKPRTMTAGMTHEICSRSVDRLLHKNIDFNTVLREDTGEWKDETFKFPDALFWEDMRTKDPYSDLSGMKDNGWYRMSEIFDAEQYSLFGDNGIQPGDAKQGTLGDCWFVSAAACVAQDPQRIKDMFLIQELNSAGIYALKLYLMGIPVTVSVDEFLPFYGKSPEYLNFAQSPPDHGLWMPILEKAAAKLFGNYEMLQGGLMGPAVQMMTGAPFYREYSKDHSADELWSYIKEKIDAGWMVTSAAYQGSGSDQDQNSSGIAYRHAYTILDAQQLSDGTKLVKVRNPWGHEKYFDDFADTPKSESWRDHPNFPGYHEANDGIWWTTSEIYHKSMQYTTGNPDVQDEKMSYFALFDINGEFNTNIELTSTEEQTVYISAYTYDSQHLNNVECNNHFGQSKFYFMHDQADEWLQPLNGHSHHKPYRMKAGENLSAILQVNFDENDLSAHDISIVVQAEKSPVKINIEGEVKSEEFPQYKLSADVTINPMRNREHSDETADDSFDKSQLPNYSEQNHDPFNVYYQFGAGNKYFYQQNNANGETTLYQENYIPFDDKMLYVGANMEFTDTMLTVEISDLITSDSVTIEVPTSSTFGECPEAQVLGSIYGDVLVQACHRQDYDEEWAVAGSDWFLHIQTELGGTSIVTTYFDMDASTMSYGFWTGDQVEMAGFGTWNWETSAFQHHKRSNEEYGSSVFLLTKGEGAAAEPEQEQESGTATALIAAVSTFGALAAASYMAKRKEVVRKDLVEPLIRA